VHRSALRPSSETSAGHSVVVSDLPMVCSAPRPSSETSAGHSVFVSDLPMVCSAPRPSNETSAGHPVDTGLPLRVGLEVDLGLSLLERGGVRLGFWVVEASRPKLPTKP
jgi:hypothetical protein